MERQLGGGSPPYLVWAGKWTTVDEDDGYGKYPQEILVEEPVSPFSLSTIIDILGGGKSCE